MTETTLPGLEPDSGAQPRIVRTTPEMAAAWLERNVSNRTLSKEYVEQYVADMTTDWVFTGQAIVFDRNGRLTDGQHRLTAQLITNMTIDWLVVTGVDPRAQDYIDIGRPRTVANQLQLKGLTHSNAVAAVARLALIYEGTRNPSKPAVRERAEKDAEMFAASGHVGRSIAQVIGGSSAAYSLAHYYLAQLDEVAADVFFVGLSKGANLDETNPILVARSYLIRNRKISGRNWTSSDRCGLVDYLFKAWNLWRADKSVRSFSRPTTRVIPK